MAGKVEYVFVYGTLRKGCGNHYLLEDAEFVGLGQTVEKYALYACGIPYVKSTEQISRVRGEVYQVDSEQLKKLDRLESHPNWYVRRIVDIELDDGTVVKAWLYFNDETDCRNLVKTGDYFDYLAKRYYDENVRTVKV